MPTLQDDDFEESKGGRRSSVATVTDPVVLSLIEWGTSASFEQDLSDWMQDNCAPFAEKVPLGDEQPLEWGQKFNDYCEWLDTSLAKFCEEEDTNPDDVSKRMAACLKEHKETDFFPAFMSISEYDVFVQHMHERAIEREREDAAKEARADGDDGNVSGCWVADPEMYDPAAAEACLKQLACPWVFRKVLKRAAKFIKNVNIRQTDSYFEAVYNIHLFGTTVAHIDVGKRNVVQNLWKKDTVVTMEKPNGKAIRFEIFENPNVPEDTVHTAKWWMDEDGEKLFWEQKIYRPDLDVEIEYTQHFIRAGSRFK